MDGDRSLLLDTHVWLWYQAFTDLLRSSTDAAITEAAERGNIFVSVISVWEFALLERAKRLELAGGVAHWTQDALSRPGINLLPLTSEIAIGSVQLPVPMHKDPADRILVASAQAHGLTLVTADKAMLAFARSTGLAYLRA